MLTSLKRGQSLLPPLQTVTLVRKLQVKPEAANPALEGFRCGAIPSRVVNFQLSLDQAKQTFEKWHQDKWLAPNKLLDQPGAEVRSALLPFWLFEAAVRVKYRGSTGTSVDEKDGGGMVWRELDWQEVGYREYPWTLSAMQVYASYKYRRDLVEAAKAPGALTRTRPLKYVEAEKQTAVAGKTDRRVKLDLPTMRQAIAWELALRNIYQNEKQLAEQTLLQRPGASGVRDVQVQITPLRRRARIVYLPAYIASYAYGERFNAHGERQPLQFQAIISGMAADHVAGERHYHPLKAQLAAAAAGSAGLAAAGVLAIIAGVDPWMLAAPENAFWVFLASTVAGVSAKLAPELMRGREETRRIQAEDADIERVMAGGVGPLDTGDDEHQAIRNNAEWRRWAEADKWHWKEEKRQRWAEAIWRQQHLRRIQRERFIQDLELARLRQRVEEQREARRTARWGHAGHAHAYGNSFSGGQTGGGRRDFLGYYRLLGLDGQHDQVTESDIKRAFRERALRWHPDKQKAADEEQHDEAVQKFHHLHDAYEVLRDAEKRRQYDNGQMGSW